MHELNERLKNIPMPSRMRSLPISDKGFPVPYFVSWVSDDGKLMRRGTGTPDFRCIDPRAILEVISREACWLCGSKLGVHKAFVIGPMCAINRASSEPPSHLECAEYAVRACPFLAQPRMVRNQKNMPDDHFAVEGMITRNPGVSLIWVTKSYKIRRVDGGVVFEVGEPESVSWWREGRTATRAEIGESIASGLPLLRAEAERCGTVDQLPRKIAKAEKLLPAA